ncbi:hypothetical protein [Variovorax sp. LG9.2]|jgi:stalled ribosome rescue protein Dom34|uniref:hypothetical protein n=1 Tax=Variovorax sp. LG9.2 TaxID=3048626 RepID=UPI002B23D5AB|nr:hypothetical protein [Variovorax sp. LG9.2]MEB0056464.1 hypothetical protein [Variovorax sp. LG9.2]
MTLRHAAVLIDHHSAQVLHFSAEQLQSSSVKEHVHYTRQHGSKVRSEHEFFGDVCDALAGIPAVLIAGSHIAQADFRHYVEKHRPALMAQIAHWETVGHPTKGELVKLARTYFAEQGEMPATPRLP